MGLVIEIGEEKDLDAIESLYNDSAEYLEKNINYPGWHKGKYPHRSMAESAIENKTLYVVKKEAKIVASVILDHRAEAGYHSARWGIEAEDTEVLIVHTLAVHPKCLKAGIAKELMQYIIDLATTKEMKAIRLDIYSKNEPARKLYEKYGFTYIDRVDLGRSGVGLKWFDLYEKLL